MKLLWNIRIWNTRYYYFSFYFLFFDKVWFDLHIQCKHLSGIGIMWRNDDLHFIVNLKDTKQLFSVLNIAFISRSFYVCCLNKTFQRDHQLSYLCNHFPCFCQSIIIQYQTSGRIPRTLKCVPLRICVYMRSRKKFLKLDLIKG